MADQAASEDVDRSDDQQGGGGGGPLTQPVPSVATLTRLADYVGDLEGHVVEALRDADSERERDIIRAHAFSRAEAAIRRMADQDAEKVPVSAFKSRKTDGRGRVSIGKEYEDQRVYVAVLSVSDAMQITGDDVEKAEWE